MEPGETTKGRERNERPVGRSKTVRRTLRDTRTERAKDRPLSIFSPFPFTSFRLILALISSPLPTSATASRRSLRPTMRGDGERDRRNGKEPTDGQKWQGSGQHKKSEGSFHIFSGSSVSKVPSVILCHLLTLTSHLSRLIPATLLSPLDLGCECKETRTERSETEGTEVEVPSLGGSSGSPSSLATRLVGSSYPYHPRLVPFLSTPVTSYPFPAVSTPLVGSPHSIPTASKSMM